MDQHPHTLVASGFLVKVICKRIDKCAVNMPVAGMHYQPGWLVYHKQVVVFVCDFERNIFRYNLHAPFAVRKMDCDYIVWLYLVVGFRGIPVNLYVAGLYGKLYPVAGGLLHVIGNVSVDTEQRLPVVYVESEMFEHSIFAQQLVCLVYVFFALRLRNIKVLFHSFQEFQEVTCLLSDRL